MYCFYKKKFVSFVCLVVVWNLALGFFAVGTVRRKKNVTETNIFFTAKNPGTLEFVVPLGIMKTGFILGSSLQYNVDNV